MNLEQITSFGSMPDGRLVESITLSGGGLRARFITFGAALQDLRLQGHGPSLVLGLNSLDDYLHHSRYFGANVGRFANRIGNGCAEIAGVKHQLDKNFLQKHHLHGGHAGMGKRVWDIVEVSENRLQLSIESPDGNMGYPGKMQVTVEFSLLDHGVFQIHYRARTDATTLCSLAHHSYFNLDGGSDILDHELQVLANHHLAVDGEMIPTGQLIPVDGGSFDFRTPQRMRSAVADTPLDHNFCLSELPKPMRLVAKLSSGVSGVYMSVMTTEAGLQVYDGRKLAVPVRGVDGREFGPHAGIALEAQGWPDAPNHSHFPPSVLTPSMRYEQDTQYVFAK